MNDFHLSATLDGLHDEVRAAQQIADSMMHKGFSPMWALGPVCARSFETMHRDLSAKVREFLKAGPENDGQSKEYRRLRQELHSMLKHGEKKAMFHL